MHIDIYPYSDTIGHHKQQCLFSDDNQGLPLQRKEGCLYTSIYNSIHIDIYLNSDNTYICICIYMHACPSLAFTSD